MLSGLSIEVGGYLMTLLEALETGRYTAKIQRKSGQWRIAVYKGRRLVRHYEHRELRAACSIAVGSSLPTDAL